MLNFTAKLNCKIKGGPFLFPTLIVTKKLVTCNCIISQTNLSCKDFKILE